MARRTNTAVWLEKYNRWQINVQKDGRRRTFTSSTPGRTGQREANRKADEWLDEDIDNARLRVSDLLDQYVEWKAQTTGYSNLRKERYHAAYIRDVIGHKKIASVTEADCQQILDKAFRHKDVNGKQVELSRKTISSIRATVLAFFRFCRRKKATSLCPDSIAVPQSARLKGKKILQPSGLLTLFSCDETILYNKRCFDQYIYAYRYIVLTGLRPGELKGLRPQDINSLDVSLHGAINDYGEHTRGKNENAIRSFTMSALARETLDKQLALTPDSEYVFDVSTPRILLKRWHRYCQANGIPEISLYELRHTFVSVVKQLPEGDVKALVGHSRNMDTFGVYGHQMTGDGERIAGSVNEAFITILRRIDSKEGKNAV